MLRLRCDRCGAACVLTAAALIGFGAHPASGSFIDADPNKDGDQSASWPEGTVENPKIITVYIPEQLADVNRMKFEMGITSMTAVLPKIGVEFKKGEPPKDAECFVDVDVSAMGLGGPPWGFGGFPIDPFPKGIDHMMITEGVIQIHPTALSMPNLLGDLMKNLGAHEFGHVLGLAEDPRAMGDRANVMDPDFPIIENPEGAITGADAFVGPSARDIMMLSEHYMTVPGPGGLVVLGVVPLLVSRRRRCSSCR